MTMVSEINNVPPDSIAPLPFPLPPRSEVNVLARSNFDGIPRDLGRLATFVIYALVWNEETKKYSKEPRSLHMPSVRVSFMKPENRGTFEQCRAVCEADPQGRYGIGIVLTRELGYTVIDVDAGEGFRTGQDAVANNFPPTWGEYSISGEGRHYFYEGALRSRNAISSKAGGIEIYSAERFIALTGLCCSAHDIANGQVGFDLIESKFPKAVACNIDETTDLGRCLTHSDEQALAIFKHYRPAIHALIEAPPASDRSEALIKVVGDLDKITGCPAQIKRILDNTPLANANHKKYLRLIDINWIPHARKSNTRALPNWIPDPAHIAYLTKWFAETKYPCGEPAAQLHVAPGGPVPLFEPADFWGAFDPPTLPRGLLPQVIEDYAYAQSKSTGADAAGYAMAALGVSAAATPDFIQVQVKQNDTKWRESARLWVVLIGDVSAMKSPIITAAASSLRTEDYRLYRANERAMQEWNALDAKERGAKPASRRLVVQDATTESVQNTLRDNPNGVLCFQDELSAWFGAMDAYSNGNVNKDRGFWLQAYNGGYYVVGRVSRDRAGTIENLSVSLLGGIQPEVIKRAANNNDDDGLLQRATPVILRNAGEGEDMADGPEVARYDSMVLRLLTITPRYAEVMPYVADTMPRPVPVRFAADAAPIVKEALRLFTLLARDLPAGKFTGHIGKSKGVFARMCLTFHCIEAATDATEDTPVTVSDFIGADIASRVYRFMRGFLLPHASVFYHGMLGFGDNHHELIAAAERILTKELKVLTKRDLQQATQVGRNMDAKTYEAILDQLDSYCWVTKIPSGKYGSPSRGEVNPRVHELFAEKAVKEREAKMRKREALIEAGLARKGRSDEIG